MKRISVPVSSELSREYNAKIPHGLRAALVRSLVRIAMTKPLKDLMAMAAQENSPEKFDIVER